MYQMIEQVAIYAKRDTNVLEMEQEHNAVREVGQVQVQVHAQIVLLGIILQ